MKKLLNSEMTNLLHETLKKEVKKENQKNKLIVIQIVGNIILEYWDTFQ